MKFLLSRVTGGFSVSLARTSVARRSLDDGVAGLERAILLGCFDDTEGQTILDRRQGVEKLALRVDGYAIGGKSVDPDKRRVSNCLGDVIDGRAISRSSLLQKNRKKKWLI